MKKQAIKIYIIMLITLTFIRLVSSFEHMISCSLAMILALLITNYKN